MRAQPESSMPVEPSLCEIWRWSIQLRRFSLNLLVKAIPAVGATGLEPEG